LLQRANEDARPVSDIPEDPWSFQIQGRCAWESSASEPSSVASEITPGDQSASVPPPQMRKPPKRATATTPTGALPEESQNPDYGLRGFRPPLRAVAASPLQVRTVKDVASAYHTEDVTP